MTAQSKWPHSSILDWFVNEEKKKSWVIALFYIAEQSTFSIPEMRSGSNVEKVKMFSILYFSL